MTTPSLLDWTRGENRIVFQRCEVCRERWYFWREFCPRCGAATPQDHASSGVGSVYAVTVVSRAPTETLRPFLPYCIVLIDMEEGFRMMGHGAPDLAIGERVRARFVDWAKQTVPYFERVPT